MAADSCQAGVQWELIEAINSATLVQLTRVFRTAGKQSPALKSLLGELKTTTTDVLRDSVLNLCEDIDGRCIVENILIGGGAVGVKTLMVEQGRNERKRVQDDSELFPVFNKAKRRAADVLTRQEGSLRARNRAQPEHRLASSRAATKSPRLPTLKYKPPQKQKQTVAEIFAADTQRRNRQQLLLEEAHKEDTRLQEEWRTASKTCGRCSKTYIESRNEDFDCMWHAGVLRTISKDNDWQKWHCCGEGSDAEGCMQSKHVDGSVSSIIRALKIKRSDAEAEAEAAGYWEDVRDDCSVCDMFDLNGIPFHCERCEGVAICTSCYMNPVPGYQPYWENKFSGPVSPRCKQCASEFEETTDGEEAEENEEPTDSRTDDELSSTATGS